MAQVKDKIQSVLSDGENKAAWLDGKGSKLRVDKIDQPRPGADEVVIKNHAIAVNPVDWKIQDSGMFVKEFPFVLGCDVAGEVYETGANVTKFKKGDRVTAHLVGLVSQKQQDGGFAHYSAAPATTTAIIPDSISYADASVIPLALDTAAHGLYSKTEEGFLGLPYPSLNPTSSGKTIVIWGGSSSVGALATQLATASGARVVSTASAHNHAFAKSLGASEVVDYREASAVDDVVKAVKSVGGDFVGVYDAISNEDSYKSVLPIAEKLGGGSVAVTLPPPKDVPSGVKIGNVFGINSNTHPIWESYITPALQQGKLRCVPEPLVVGKGLDSVQKGLDTNKKGVSAKKVVIEL